MLRAVAQETGKVPSRIVTLNYILNENHTLPVLSLVTDDVGYFNAIYNAGAALYRAAFQRMEEAEMKQLLSEVDHGEKNVAVPTELRRRLMHLRWSARRSSATSRW